MSQHIGTIIIKIRSRLWKMKIFLYRMIIFFSYVIPSISSYLFFNIYDIFSFKLI